MMRPTPSILLVLLLALLAPSGSFAACAEPPQQLVWSWPAKGMADIPVNAGIFVVPAANQSVRVYLNDQELSAIGDSPPHAWTFDPGPLAPSSIQKLVIEFSSESGTQKTLPAREFTTGTSTASAEAAAIAGHVERDPLTTHVTRDACGQAFVLLDCLDTGIGAIFDLQMSDSAPGWAVRSEAAGPWTAFGDDCDPIALTILEEEDPCFDIIALGPTAELMTPTTLCPLTHEYPSATEGGCSIDAGTTTPLIPLVVLFGALGILAPRRRAPPEKA
jgi:hypothetical protein